MIVERYIACIRGTPTDAFHLSQLEVIAYARRLRDALAVLQSPATVSIHEETTGETRACWMPSSDGWRVRTAPGWFA